MDSVKAQPFYKHRYSAQAWLLILRTFVSVVGSLAFNGVVINDIIFRQASSTHSMRQILSHYDKHPCLWNGMGDIVKE